MAEQSLPAGITGLTSAEVAHRIEQGKINKFVDKTSKSTWQIVLSNLVDLPNAIIFTAVGFLIIYGQLQDAFLISGIMFLNMLISIAQEIQARNSLQKINLINNEPVTVVRDGRLVTIEPGEIVVDDTIKLESGKYLYVDGALQQAENLLLDESILTGESDYVSKTDGDELLSGSFVVAGRGFYRATKVGADSFANQITQAAKKYVNYLSPLQMYINQIVQILTYVTLFVVALLLSLNYFVMRMEQVAVLKAVISVVSSMIPQGIVMTLTIAFTLGVVRMYRQRILVQKASAVETLAGIDILCMDKTGTLTENKLKVENYMHLAGKEVASELSADLISIFVTETLEKNKTVLALGKYLEVEGRGLTGYKITAQLPFTSKTKASGVEFKYQDQYWRVMLGSIDSLLELMPQKHRAEMEELEQKYANKGQRNLFFLVKKSARAFSPKETQAGLEWLDPGMDYHVLAFVSLKDTLREGARDIIDSFLRQGVKPIVISGDSPHTVLALARQLKIEGLTNAISGKELAALTLPTEIEEAILGHDIFARVTPEQKLQIIKVMQGSNKRVAMIGDGVNDALAIKQANLGISMASGANVTKNIADVILLDDDLRKLAAVMAEGKEILFNTLRSAELLLVKNAYSLIIILGSLLLGLSFPLTPRGLFILAFLNSNLPILIILAERNLKLKEIKFMPELASFVVGGGVTAGFLGLLILIHQKYIVAERDLGLIQTQLLIFLILTGIINSLYVLNRKRTLFGLLFGTKKSIVGVITLLSLVGIIYIAPLRNFFELTVPNPNDWLALAAIAGVYLAALLIITNHLHHSKAFQKWISRHFVT